MFRLHVWGALHPHTGGGGHYVVVVAYMCPNNFAGNIPLYLLPPKIRVLPMAPETTM